MLFKTKQKEICKTINTYFLRPNFLEEICNYSNNKYQLYCSTQRSKITLIFSKLYRH